MFNFVVGVAVGAGAWEFLGEKIKEKVNEWIAARKK